MRGQDSKASSSTQKAGSPPTRSSQPFSEVFLISTGLSPPRRQQARGAPSSTRWPLPMDSQQFPSVGLLPTPAAATWGDLKLLGQGEVMLGSLGAFWLDVPGTVH